MHNPVQAECQEKPGDHLCPAPGEGFWPAGLTTSNKARPLGRPCNLHLTIDSLQRKVVAGFRNTEYTDKSKSTRPPIPQIPTILARLAGSIAAHPSKGS